MNLESRSVHLVMLCESVNMNTVSSFVFDDSRVCVMQSELYTNSWKQMFQTIINLKYNKKSYDAQFDRFRGTTKKI